MEDVDSYVILIFFSPVFVLSAFIMTDRMIVITVIIVVVISVLIAVAGAVCCVALTQAETDLLACRCVVTRMSTIKALR